MGYYIQGPARGKGKLLQEQHGAEAINLPPSTIEAVPAGKALVCIIDNGAFEAAGLIYDARELRDFSESDGRPRSWFIMDEGLAHKLAGYTPKPTN